MNDDMNDLNPINLKIKIDNVSQGNTPSEHMQNSSKNSVYRSVVLCVIATCLIACSVLLAGYEWVTAIMIVSAFVWLALDRKMWNNGKPIRTHVINISEKEAWAALEKIADKVIDAEVKELEDEVKQLRSKLKSPNKDSNEGQTKLRKEYDKLKDDYSKLYKEYGDLEGNYSNVTKKCQEIEENNTLLRKEKDTIYREYLGQQGNNLLLLEKMQLFDAATKEFGEEIHSKMRKEIEKVLQCSGMHFEDFSEDTMDLYDYEKANIKEIDYVSRAIVNNADKTVILKGMVYLPK